MSTVTLSKPHCAMTSAVKPEGVASQAFTTALPEAQICLTLLFATLFVLPFFIHLYRHCESVSDEAIQSLARSWIASLALAMTTPIKPLPAGCLPRSHRLHALCSLSPPRYRQATEHRSSCVRRASSSPAHQGSARLRRRRPA